VSLLFSFMLPRLHCSSHVKAFLGLRMERINLIIHILHSFHRFSNQTAELNSPSCIFAPPEPNSVIGNTEEIEVAWCVRKFSPSLQMKGADIRTPKQRSSHPRWCPPSCPLCQDPLIRPGPGVSVTTLMMKEMN
jgi:hypothetical protein